MSAPTGLAERLRDAERDEARGLLGRPEGPDDDDGHRLGQRIVEQRLDERRGASVIRVDEHEVRRVRPRELERRLRIVGPFALEGARTDHRLLGESVRERLAAYDEHGDGREPGRILGIFRHGHAGGGFAGRRLSPGKGREVVQDLGEEHDLFVAKPAGLGAPVEHGEHFLEGPSHRLEPQETRARPERVQAAAKLVARRLRRGVVLERVE